MLPLRRTWPRCEPVWAARRRGSRGRIRCAWAACGRTAIGARSDQGAEAHRDIFIDHCSSFGSEFFQLLFLEQSSICALHAELEMNVGFSGHAPIVGPILSRAKVGAVVGRGSRSETHASALSSTFLRVAAGSPRWLPARHPHSVLPRSPGLSEDAGLSPSRVASLVFGAHATPRGLWEPGTIDHPCRRSGPLKNETSKSIGRPNVVSAPRILVVEDEIDVALLISLQSGG